ncbi:MAG: hypothetical protein KF810_17425 [Rhizobiaceae bacterium]|nr:hypothetical protein [Rhizobiaceae bacterium]
MNIVTERDGLEAVCEHHVWTLYLVENDGGLYTHLATLESYSALEKLWKYLSLDPRKAQNDNSPIAGQIPWAGAPLPDDRPKLFDLESCKRILPDEALPF